MKKLMKKLVMFVLTSITGIVTTGVTVLYLLSQPMIYNISNSWLAAVIVMVIAMFQLILVVGVPYTLFEQEL